MLLFNYIFWVIIEVINIEFDLDIEINEVKIFDNFDDIIDVVNIEFILFDEIEEDFEEIIDVLIWAKNVE